MFTFSKHIWIRRIQMALYSPPAFLIAVFFIVLSGLIVGVASAYHGFIRGVKIGVRESGFKGALKGFLIQFKGEDLKDV